MSLQELRPTTEAYLELSRTSKMEIFCEKSYQVLAVNYFHKSSSIVVVCLSSKYTFFATLIT